MLETHDLNGVQTLVFDASRIAWNLSSTTRACALLRRALAWCNILKMLSSHQWERLPEFYQGVSEYDADVGRWVLEKLHETIEKDMRYRKPLAELYSSTILGNARPDVKTMAASNLASILENLLSSQSDALSNILLPWDAIMDAFRPEKNIEVWNREATDAELRLRGCLLAIRLSLDHQQAPSLLEKDIRSLTIKLQSALSEETVSRFATNTSYPVESVC